jgi:hypothetical protein
MLLEVNHRTKYLLESFSICFCGTVLDTVDGGGGLKKEGSCMKRNDQFELKRKFCLNLSTSFHFLSLSQPFSYKNTNASFKS